MVGQEIAGGPVGGKAHGKTSGDDAVRGVGERTLCKSGGRRLRESERKDVMKRNYG